MVEARAVAEAAPVAVARAIVAAGLVVPGRAGVRRVLGDVTLVLAELVRSQVAKGRAPATLGLVAVVTRK